MTGIQLSEAVRVRFDPDTYRQVEKAAEEEGQSVSGWIRRVVKLALRPRRKAEAESCLVGRSS